MLACYNGHRDVIKILIDHSQENIDFNARNDIRWTAFMYACNKGHKDVVKLLLNDAKMKCIQIPTSTHSLRNIYIPKEIRDLIREYNAKK